MEMVSASGVTGTSLRSSVLLRMAVAGAFRLSGQVEKLLYRWRVGVVRLSTTARPCTREEDLFGWILIITHSQNWYLLAKWLGVALPLRCVLECPDFMGAVVFPSVSFILCGITFRCVSSQRSKLSFSVCVFFVRVQHGPVVCVSCVISAMGNVRFTQS